MQSNTEATIEITSPYYVAEGAVDHFAKTDELFSDEHDTEDVWGEKEGVDLSKVLAHRHVANILFGLMLLCAMIKSYLVSQSDLLTKVMIKAWVWGNTRAVLALSLGCVLSLLYVAFLVVCVRWGRSLDKLSYRVALSCASLYGLSVLLSVMGSSVEIVTAAVTITFCWMLIRLSRQTRKQIKQQEA